MNRKSTEPLAQAFWPWALLVLAGFMQAASLAWPGADDVTWHTKIGLIYGAPQPYLQFAGMALMVKVLTWAERPLQAGFWAWLCGTAQGVSTTWWLYISMATYGQAPMIAAVIAVLLLNAFLALYLAILAMWLHRSNAFIAWRAPWAWAAACVLAEWARATWLGGFPWGSAAVAHVDGLGFLAPILGSLGVGALVALMAAWFAVMPWSGKGSLRAVFVAAAACVIIHPSLRWSDVDLSQTAAMHRVPVTLLQGNINPTHKFEEQKGIPEALSWYGAELTRSRRGITIAPETAIPWLPQNVEQGYWSNMWARIASSEHAVIFGLPIGSKESRYYNAAWFVRPEDAERLLERGGQLPSLPASQRYAKTHLVPFGEYTPALFGWWTEVLGLPLNGFSSGGLNQVAPQWNDLRWGINICYEDLFGDELAERMWQTHPNVWVNLSNIAWFGDTVAVPQHLNIARWRARELGRATVRATNSGATAIINHLGQVDALLPAFERGVLEGEVEGREGLTPYVRWAGRWGHWPWVIIALWVLGLVEWRHRARDRAARRI